MCMPNERVYVRWSSSLQCWGVVEIIVFEIRISNTIQVFVFVF